MKTPKKIPQRITPFLWFDDLRDKYGVSWQIVPTILPELLTDKDPAKAQRVMEAMLKMVKLDVKQLKAAAAATFYGHAQNETCNHR